MFSCYVFTSHSLISSVLWENKSEWELVCICLSFPGLVRAVLAFPSGCVAWLWERVWLGCKKSACRIISEGNTFVFFIRRVCRRSVTRVYSGRVGITVLPCLCFLWRQWRLCCWCLPEGGLPERNHFYHSFCSPRDWSFRMHNRIVLAIFIVPW